MGNLLINRMFDSTVSVQDQSGGRNANGEWVTILSEVVAIPCYTQTNSTGTSRKPSASGVRQIESRLFYTRKLDTIAPIKAGRNPEESTILTWGGERYRVKAVEVWGLSYLKILAEWIDPQ